MKVIARTPRRPKTPRTQTAHQTDRKADVEQARDPVKVFCRVRPLRADADLCCVRVKNSATVVLTTPELVTQHKPATYRELQYLFNHVFEPRASQDDVYAAVAQPLVDNLLHGRNSLLFTYGVTGSGKTYTMTGDKHHRGIMPRCLDAIFRTISNYQAKKFTFKPDHLNGFEILSEADAALERQAEMKYRFPARRAIKCKDSETEIASDASDEVPVITGIDLDNMYAVFVTYIEIYNNCVYDLLEDNLPQKSLQSKIIRADAQRNMYVHGVTEIEVKSMGEAIDAFQFGQKRKRMAHTVLNAESSRSHCVFNIRLVQAPTDCLGEAVLQDERAIAVSQLSLVDLAGSERSSRTNNTGIRLREASNINNSLMTLRTCLEYLRENQQAPAGAAPPKMIPYRDSKLTHMFRNYFEGEGQVTMVVCINPRAEDCDENMQVMKFAEKTQEVQIARDTPIKPDLGLTPGRRKANRLFAKAVGNLDDLGHSEARKLNVDIGLVYSLGPGFPDYKLDSPEAESTVQKLMLYLEQRIEKRKLLCSDLDNRCNNFRSDLMQAEKEVLSLRTELASVNSVYKQARERIQILENKLCLQENCTDTLNNKLKSREHQIDELTRKLKEQQNLVSKKERENEEQKKKFYAKMAAEAGKMEHMFEMKLREQHARMQEKVCIRDEKLRLVSNILKSEQLPNKTESAPCYERLSHDNNLPIVQAAQPTGADLTQAASAKTDSTPNHPRGAAAANIRHRRSCSAGEKWLEHRAPNPVPLDTILQPYLKNRKSITKLTDVKDLTSNKNTKYCLVSQEADTDGDVETKLYKGNVIPTCGGGAQVIFEDVECLKQKSPVPSPTRKRHINATNQHAATLHNSGIGAPSAISAVAFSTKCGLPSQ